MKHISVFIFTLLLPLMLFAQQHTAGGERPRFNPQEFQQRMQQTITREAELTTEEATAFFPIYNEMKQKQRTINDQIRDLKRQTPGCGSEADYLTAITRIKQLQVEMAEVERDYYQRLCGAVSPVKVFKAMRAEDNFHRSMVREGRRQQGGKRRQ
ncbi:MAG: hypothetical protein J5486_02810 [Bacteroidaceae bacterium]|nr:hypothetical protein [Bacteroidaceae bacterium]